MIGNRARLPLSPAGRQTASPQCGRALALRVRRIGFRIADGARCVGNSSFPEFIWGGGPVAGNCGSEPSESQVSVDTIGG